MFKNLKISPLFCLTTKPSNKEILAELADFFRSFLEEGRFSFFATGMILKEWFKFFPQDSLWMREKIKESRLEILGGTFDDILPPFFKQQIFDYQIKKHQDLLQTRLAYQPSGYFNSSLVWEIGLLPQLVQRNFSYALVDDCALASALGRPSRVSGWFSTENNGSLLRILPIDSVLSSAFSDSLSTFKNSLTALPSNGKTWIVLLEVPVDSLDSLKNFREKCHIFFETGIQTWTISHIIEQQQRESFVNLLSSVGKIGLPPSATSCRELLLRRPEINFLHKSLLSVLRKIELHQNKIPYEEILDSLFPIMAARYFLDIGNGEGVRSPLVRFNAHSKILNASCRIDDILKTDSMRAEVTDYMLVGGQQVLLENTNISMLVDPAYGGSLRSLNFKNCVLNFLTAFRDDGYPSLAFAEHILATNFSSALSLNEFLQDRSRYLRSPYDFQLERSTGILKLKMTSEQVLPVDETKSFIFHLEKNYSIFSEKTLFEISYNLTNMMLQGYTGYFGTELELGTLALNFSEICFKVDGKKIQSHDELPKIFSEIHEFEYRCPQTKGIIKFEFLSDISCMVAPILGSDNLASPSVLQGIRLFFFKKIELAGMKNYEFIVRTSLMRTLV